MKISELFEAAKDFPDLKNSQEKAYNAFQEINTLLEYATVLKKKHIHITAPEKWSYQIQVIDNLIATFNNTVDKLIDGNQNDVLKTPIIKDLTSYKNMLELKRQHLDKV